MIISIHQPAYLPWLGYIERIKKSDLFIFLDTVQFEKNSFTNRNLIKGANGPYWLTIPVKKKGHLSKSLLDTEIVRDVDWRKSHLMSIKSSYSKSVAFHDKYIFLYANVLKIENGILTGELEGRIIDAQAKADLLVQHRDELGLQPEQVLAMGDGANDIDMITAAGLGIAFNAKPALQEVADTSVNHRRLDEVLQILGIPAEEVVRG